MKILRYSCVYAILKSAELIDVAATEVLVLEDYGHTQRKLASIVTLAMI